MGQGTTSVARRATTATAPVEDRRAAPDRRFARRGAAHDARLAVATVRALLATLLERDPTLPGDMVATLEDAAFEIDRLATLLGPDVGRMSDLCDVAGIARDVGRAQEAVSGVPVRCLGRGAFAAADALTTWRVLTNVVHNACRAATTAGDAAHVTIVVSADDDPRTGVVVDVHDTGPGVFPTWTPGIGMDVVTRLVADLGGSLELRGAPGGGTHVRICLLAATRARTTTGLVST